MDTPKIAHLEFVVDWMNFTAHERGKRTYQQIPMYDNRGVWTPDKAVHGYDIAYKNEFGARTMWSSKRDDMGVHVQYSGSTINKYLSDGISARSIMKHHSDAQDICKRIDLAIDARGTRLSIVRLYNELKEGSANTKAKTYNLITGNTGDTLYIGSRTSDMFLRIYDKGAQLKTGENWKRIELEIKGTRAVQVARWFSKNTDEEIGNMTRQLIADMAQFTDDEWKSVIGELTLHIGKSKEVEPDTKGWLLGQVAPAMARYMNDSGDYDILDKFLMTLYALTGTKSKQDEPDHE